jgi:hypothetical protein
LKIDLHEIVTTSHQIGIGRMLLGTTVLIDNAYGGICISSSMGTSVWVGYSHWMDVGEGGECKGLGRKNLK